ncbi:hypothetical protein JAAARDRAFT_194033 [Jaapia argillacea MUCL 33604]|uniref:Uncharacterized protein n=1 Tax=Jaapia argillacea MUCL 33604 TaxID=933084 RepID=A0A067Q580_9AGAM|nr:hypothetical protein JAAARDRAFT_194033 [Jaapia argillacea MUCL 33604]
MDVHFRSTIYHAPSSSSYSTDDDYSSSDSAASGIDEPRKLTFTISSMRSQSPLLQQRGESSRARYEFTPMVVDKYLSTTRHGSHSPPTIPHHVQEIYPGIMSDGSITQDYYPIRPYLAAADSVGWNRDIRTLAPPPTDKRLFALTALMVLNQPHRPSHWVFWSRDEKFKSAEIVNRVYHAKPSLIHSPVCWIGIPESLWALGAVQAWHKSNPQIPREFYESVHTPAERRNLRKRKQIEDAVNEDEAQEEDEEVVESPKKRPKTKRVTSNKRVTRAQFAESEAPDATLEEKMEAMEEESAPLALPHVTPPPPPTRQNVASEGVPTNPTSTSPSPERDTAPSRIGTRQKRAGVSTPPLPPIPRALSSTSGVSSSGSSTVVSTGADSDTTIDVEGEAEPEKSKEIAEEIEVEAKPNGKKREKKVAATTDRKTRANLATSPTPPSDAKENEGEEANEEEEMSKRPRRAVRKSTTSYPKEIVQQPVSGRGRGRPRKSESTPPAPDPPTKVKVKRK